MKFNFVGPTINANKTLPATVWFLGGKQVTFFYARKTIIPTIDQGINPGLMEFKPFK